MYADAAHNTSAELQSAMALGVERPRQLSLQLTEQTVLQAYKRAALKYHPDKATAGDRDEAEKKFKQVNAANSILSDPAKRQRYDAGRHPLLLRQSSKSTEGMALKMQIPRANLPS